MTGIILTTEKAGETLVLILLLVIVIYFFLFFEKLGIYSTGGEAGGLFSMQIVGIKKVTSAPWHFIIHCPTQDLLDYLREIN